MMSIPDSLTLQYFELVTDVPDEEIEEFREGLNHETTNPMMLKKRLAREIIIQLYSQKEATEAEEHFVRVFQKRKLPEEIDECRISFKDLSPQQMEITSVDISKLLVAIRLAKSRTEANRLIEQGAVAIDGERITSYAAKVKSGSIIKVGKRHFARVIDNDILK